MKKKLLFLFMLVLLSMCLIKPLGSVYAASDPNEIEEIKEKSPLQIKGKVMDDVLLLDTSDERGYPSQTRIMVLQVDEIIKRSDNLLLDQDTSLNVVYTYVPSWISMNGGEKMDIMVGVRLKFG